MPLGADTNGLIGALLRDLAAIQSSKPSEWGYKRAAHVILALEEPIETFRQANGTLKKIDGIGPKSEKVILEVLATGGSSTVEQAVAKSGKAADIARRRSLRDHFLTRAQALAVLRDASLGGPTLVDYRGDLQMHSTYSDGTQTLATIVETALARGYEFCGVTDHSYGLRIAKGVSMAELAEQHAAIDALNREYDGRFRLIKGIEANIQADGSIDMTASDRSSLELVLAAPHSGLRSDDDQTARMIAAVETPGVHILAHPTGRQYGSRAGVRANWDEVFGAAEREGVAIEIDGDPARQDIDYTLAARAVGAGCLIALDSDAHAPHELRNAEWAVAHARLAGVPVDRVINCWPTQRLLDWLAAHPAR